MPDAPQCRVALYARVSTTGRGQDAGLQLDELRTAAAARGWTVVETFDDTGISGAQERRPALDAMMKQAKRQRFDVVMVWKLDRLARSLSHLLAVTELLRKADVGLVSLRDAHVDTTTPGGRFTLHVFGAVAEFERALIQERVVAGVRRAQAAGKHCGRPRVEVDVGAARTLQNAGRALPDVAALLGVSLGTLKRRLAEEVRFT